MHDALWQSLASAIRWSLCQLTLIGNVPHRALTSSRRSWEVKDIVRLRSRREPLTMAKLLPM
jgi:hypothetical protein